MADLDDEDDPLDVVDGIDDAVVALSGSLGATIPDENRSVLGASLPGMQADMQGLPTTPS